MHVNFNQIQHELQKRGMFYVKNCEEFNSKDDGGHSRFLTLQNKKMEEL